jgi:Arc/MetJ family transcription regulator
MRTNVVLDDDLIRTALKLSGFKTKRKAIEEGLRLLVQLNLQRNVRSFRGRLKWVGNLSRMRMDK